MPQKTAYLIFELLVILLISGKPQIDCGSSIACRFYSALLLKSVRWRTHAALVVDCRVVRDR
jgi:hypothetical protein